MSGKRTVRAQARLAVGDEAGLPTELCIASDGVIYVNAEGIDPAKLKGRKMFHGFAMTEEEMGIAVHQIHRLAFNVTMSVQEGMREKRVKRLKQRQQRAGQLRQAPESKTPRATRQELPRAGTHRQRPNEKPVGPGQKGRGRSRKQRP